LRATKHLNGFCIDVVGISFKQPQQKTTFLVALKNDHKRKFIARLMNTLFKARKLSGFNFDSGN
jgi:hypothetical protein